MMIWDAEQRRKPPGGYHGILKSYPLRLAYELENKIDQDPGIKIPGHEAGEIAAS